MSKQSKKMQGFSSPLKQADGEFHAAAPGWATPDEDEEQYEPMLSQQADPNAMTRRERRGDDYPYFEFSVHIHRAFSNNQARGPEEWGPMEIAIEYVPFANKSDFLNKALEDYIEKNKHLLTQPEPADPPIVRRKMRKGLRVNDQYSQVTSYYFVKYRAAWEHIAKFKGSKRDAMNEAVRDLLLQHRDILAQHGVDVDKLPTYPQS